MLRAALAPRLVPFTSLCRSRISNIPSISLQSRSTKLTVGSKLRIANDHDMYFSNAEEDKIDDCPDEPHQGESEISYDRQHEEIASMLVEDEFDDKNNPHPVKDILDSATSAHSENKSTKGAKIHDFCLGIPFGGLLVSSGIILFILTGSAYAVQFGVLLGGLLLTLSISSLNAWKKGKSCMSHIQGQAAISFVMLFAAVQKAFETRSSLPALAALISGAMFGFYFYVFISGGNPPPKKPKH